MRLVVLHGHQGFGIMGQRVGILGREIVGMQVVGDQFGLDTKQVPVEIDGCLQVFQGFQVFHVADVLAEKGEIVAREAERVLELGTDGQDRLGVER